MMADDTDWNALARMDPTIADMLSAKIPLTRENYIEAKYGMPGTDDHPKEWTREHEEDLPEPFQNT